MSGERPLSQVVRGTSTTRVRRVAAMCGEETFATRGEEAAYM